MINDKGGSGMIPEFRFRKELQPPKRLYNFLNKSKPKYYKNQISKHKRGVS